MNRQTHLKKIISAVLGVVFIVSAFCMPAGAYRAYERVWALGDVDKNGEVTATDALLALQCSVSKIELGYIEQDSADVNEDWAVTATDALLILQCSVGKTELTTKQDIYDAYEFNYIEPTGLEANTIYVVNSPKAVKFGEIRHHIARFFVAMQGLINRNVDKHHVGVYYQNDNTDQFWFDYITSDGKTFEGMNVVNVGTFEQLMEVFMPFIKQRGLVLWDANVPSTANVAGTICGLDGYLPVMYDTDEGSLYSYLISAGVEVKQSLVGLFDNAALGKKIADTDLSSTGSAKCDAYVWAMEKYLPRCNLELIAYTLDGAPMIAGNPVRENNLGNTGSSDTVGIPNQDYFVAKQCFFMDLSSFGGESASDDPTQPRGTDAATLRRLLKMRYDLAGEKFGMILGFPPWHVKYTNEFGIGGVLAPARLEWHFVETATAYNCGIEADAAHPCWMSNGSLYTKFEITAEMKGNKPADETEHFDENTRYFAIGWTGDFDCSPWLKERAPRVWSDSGRGSIPMTYAYNVNLVDRIPMVFDYVWSNKTDNDYFTAGEGMGYIMPSMLFEGSTGKEASPTTRTLKDGARQYIHYAKPYYDLFGLKITGTLLNGFTNIGTDVCGVYDIISPSGVFLQNSAAPMSLFQHENTPYLRLKGFGVDADPAVTSANFRLMFEKGNFVILLYNNNGTNYGTASGAKVAIDGLLQAVESRDFKYTYKYVDIETFTKLIVESNTAKRFED